MLYMISSLSVTVVQTHPVVLLPLRVQPVILTVVTVQKVRRPQIHLHPVAVAAPVEAVVVINLNFYYVESLICVEYQFLKCEKCIWGSAGQPESIHRSCQMITESDSWSGRLQAASLAFRDFLRSCAFHAFSWKKNAIA